VTARMTMTSVSGWSVQRCPGCGHLIAVLESWPGAAIGIRITRAEALLLGRVRHPSYRNRLRKALRRWIPRVARIELRGHDNGVRATVVRKEGESHTIPLVAGILAADLTELPLLIETELVEGFEDIMPVDEDLRTFAQFIEQVSPEDFRDFDVDRASPTK